MQTIYEELDEAKSEIEKLKSEYKIKLELSESLKRSHNEQQIKIQEASSKVEKLTQELYEKEDEISSIKQFFEDLKSNLKEKEAIVKQLASANDKLRASCEEKIVRYEEENRLLASALEEANGKDTDQERQICSLKQEIEVLKGLVSISSTKKFSEAKKASESSNELRQRDDVLLSLDEAKRIIEEQLKWKKEQFNHLEEAHEKLRHLFTVKQKEWDKERDLLLDDISKLQENFDSQIRISEGLQNRLLMCNEALAREESKRKYLDIQLSESKICFDNVLSEYDEAKSKIESLTDQMDKEIAYLRDSFSKKEAFYKEMEYQFKRLEHEKQELILSLKELQEAGTHSSSSSLKYRNKLRALERVHQECSANLKAKEAEWKSQSEKLLEDLVGCKLELECKNIDVQKLNKEVELVNRECATILEDNEAKWHSQFESLKMDLGVCGSELESRNATVDELKRELEDCDSLILELALQNEETSIMVVVLKSKFLELQLKLVDDYADMDLKSREIKESFSLLSKQLQMKNSIEEQEIPLQKEFERQKELLNESFKSRLHLEEQLLSMKRDSSKVRDALDTANEELAEKLCETNAAEFELEIWKSIVEQLKASLEGNRKLRREVEACLLADAEIELNLKEEKESLVNVIKEKDITIDCLLEQLHMLKEEMCTRNAKISLDAQKVNETSLEQEWARKELEGAILAEEDAERNHEQERESLHHLVEERDQRVDDLQQLFGSLEQEFQSSSSSFATYLSEMQVEIDSFREAWEKIAHVAILKEIEVQENNLMITELESDLSDLQEKVEPLEKSSLILEERLEELEAVLEAKQLEITNLTHKLEDSMKLSSETENSLSNMKDLVVRISMLCGEDIQLMETLASMVQTFDTKKLEIELIKKDELFDSIKENVELYSSPVSRKVVTFSDERSPLKALN